MDEIKVTKTSRSTAFTRADEAAFSRLLRDEFGPAVFVDGQRWETPEVPQRPSIIHCQKDNVTVLFPDHPDWFPFTVLDAGQRYNVRVTRRYFSYWRSAWDWTRPRGANWAWDSPTLTKGTIGTHYRHDDPVAKQFVHRLWRLLDRFSVRQFATNFPHLDVDFYAFYGEEPPKYDPRKRGGSELRAGPDALRWCLKSPGRMIDGSARPREGWSFPEWLKPYYRDEELAEDAIESVPSPQS